MKNNVTVDVSGLESFKLDIIANNYCGAILPAALIEEDDGIKIVYQLEEYEPIPDYLRPVEAMEIIRDLIMLVAELAYFMFTSFEYSLDIEDLYRNKRNSRLAATLQVHNGDKECASMHKIISQVAERTNTYGQEMLHKLENEMSGKSIMVKDLVQIIDKKCEEIYQCDIQ